MGRLMAAFPWDSSPLGPVSGWPSPLRTVVGMLLRSKAQIVLFWGPHLVALYNDAYAPTIGGKHPRALGRPARENWGELWDTLGPMLGQVRLTARAFGADNYPFQINRHGFLEQVYFDISYDPVPGADGEVAGVFCTVTETTARVFAERRLAALRELSIALSTTLARSDGPLSLGEALPKAALAAIAGHLAQDVSRAAIYRHGSHGKPVLVATTDPAPRTRPQATGTTEGSPFAEILERVRREGRPVLWEGGGDGGPQRLLGVPLTAEQGPMGVLVVSVCPLVAADAEYRKVIDLAAGQISSALTTAAILERERERADDLTRVAADNARLYREAQREIADRQAIEAQFLHLTDTLEKMVEERTGERDRLWRVSGELMAVGTADSHIKAVNPAWETLLGHDERLLVGAPMSLLVHPDDREPSTAALRAMEPQGPPLRFENRLRDSDGTYHWIAWTIVAHGALFYMVGRDVTEEKQARDALAEAHRQLIAQTAERERAEEALRQAQKMEVIGQLTGGVAHDFNNLLTIILGNLETLIRHIDGASPPDPARVRTLVERATLGAERAAALTQRLLAFSRRQPLDPRPLDLNRLTLGLIDLLHRTIGEKIALDTRLSMVPVGVLADANQLESVVLNLALNARDAMPTGGRLILETTADLVIEAPTAEKRPAKGNPAGAPPGTYAALRVTDTGKGMEAGVLARVFDPFFTTKDVGQGTGLGLSQAYGFIKQSGGHIGIESEPGQGTTVTILLPRLEGALPLPEESDRDETPAALGGLEITPPPGDPSILLLVVEDDPSVRAHSTASLRELGYQVIEAGNGAEALGHLAAHPDVALMFTDIGLPGGMDGRQLAELARRNRPDLAVVLTTGYARDALNGNVPLAPRMALLTKPFSFTALALKVHEVLPPRPAPQSSAPQGPVTVLLVEDDPLVSLAAADLLLSLGCAVDQAYSVADALAQASAATPDVAVIDIGLPDGRGDDLAQTLRQRLPGLPIVIASGYDRSEIDARFGDDPRLRFLGKPYLDSQLEAALTGALGHPLERSTAPRA
ncbi:PAS/PAC sensor hybrid histidine kinase [Rhodospirillum rubrum F11]|nr:PAS/PAC sensor hybrid histidine kinase [Rhodospirillum rubrum F11]